MSDDMLSWLRQQIEHRKALAEAACGDTWAHAVQLVQIPGNGGYEHASLYEADDNDLLVSYRYGEQGLTEDDLAHIAFNDPRQVIADCAADTAILEECAKYFGGENHELMWHASNLARRVVADLTRSYGSAPEELTP